MAVLAIWNGEVKKYKARWKGEGETEKNEPSISMSNSKRWNKNKAVLLASHLFDCIFL